MNLGRTLEDRAIRTLILAIAFFLSGLAFFALRMSGGAEDEPSYSIATRGMKSTEAARPLPGFADFPPPDVFHQFSYKRGEALTVDGECRDAFYVILIYEAGTDYRVSPMNARFNTAFPCKGGTFSERIPIDELFLTEGGRYYVVKAEQGPEGAWYDPY